MVAQRRVYNSHNIVVVVVVVVVVIINIIIRNTRSPQPPVAF
jgi:hypothetical protein